MARVPAKGTAVFLKGARSLRQGVHCSRQRKEECSSFASTGVLPKRVLLFPHVRLDSPNPQILMCFFSSKTFLSVYQNDIANVEIFKWKQCSKEIKIDIAMIRVKMILWGIIKGSPELPSIPDKVGNGSFLMTWEILPISGLESRRNLISERNFFSGPLCKGHR